MKEKIINVLRNDMYIYPRGFEKLTWVLMCRLLRYTDPKSMTFRDK